LSHLHFYWLRSGTADLQKTAQYIGAGDVPPSPVSSLIDTGFPKGQALASWLQTVGATTTMGQIDLYGSQQSVVAVNAPTQRWIYVPTNINDTATPKRPAIEYLTFNTPVDQPPAQQCGRVVLTDIHIKEKVPAPTGGNLGGDDSDPSKPFPQ